MAWITWALLTKQLVLCKKDIDYLEYTAEITRKFLETICDKYAFCLKEKSVGKALQKLKYTIKLAETKVRELEDNIQEDESPEAALKEPSKRKSFQDSLPHPRVSAHSHPDTRGLKSSLPGEKIPLAQPDASNPKSSAIRESNKERDYLFLFKNARYSGKGNAYNGSSNKRNRDNNRTSMRDSSHGGVPDELNRKE